LSSRRATTDVPVDLSVIIVSYNCLDYVKRCVASVTRHPPNAAFEIIVMDNASQDGTVQGLRSLHPSITVVASNDNVGYGAAINRGVRMARGQSLLFLNPDAEVSAGALDTLLAFAKGRGNLGVVGPRLVYGDGRPQPSARRFPSPWRLWSEVMRLPILFPGRRRTELLLGTNFPSQDTTRTVDWLSGACHLISRSTWEQVGELTESTFCGFDDLDYCLRTRQNALDNWLVADATVIHHCGATVSSRWSPREVDTLAINNAFVIVQEHWPRWRVKLYCGAELFGTLSDAVLAGRAHRSQTTARLALLTKLLLGIVRPVQRCEPVSNPRLEPVPASTDR
jgi:N-acetylglucosaminyl-diphospho-decaprenol L-rhamnosyltransferase